MLSPMELQNKQIQTNKRKYDRAEMDEYLELVFENYKELYEANKDLKKKIKTLSDGVQYYRSIESTLQKALILAEKTSKETKDAAILKAEAIEKDANTKADQIVAEAENEYNSIKGRCVSLVQQFNQYKVQLKQAASAQLELINSDSFDIYSPELDALVDKEGKDPASTVAKTQIPKETPVTPLAPIPPVMTAPKKKDSPISFEEVKSLDEIYPEVEKEKSHIAEVKPAKVVEPIEAVTQTPVEATPIDAIKGTTMSFEEESSDTDTSNKSLDSLLNDLNMSSKKKKTKNSEEEDPFEFLGSIDDF